MANAHDIRKAIAIATAQAKARMDRRPKPEPKPAGDDIFFTVTAAGKAAVGTVLDNGGKVHLQPDTWEEVIERKGAKILAACKALRAALQGDDMTA